MFSSEQACTVCTTVVVRIVGTHSRTTGHWSELVKYQQFTAIQPNSKVVLRWWSRVENFIGGGHIFLKKYIQQYDFTYADIDIKYQFRKVKVEEIFQS